MGKYVHAVQVPKQLSTSCFTVALSAIVYMILKDSEISEISQRYSAVDKNEQEAQGP